MPSLRGAATGAATGAGIGSIVPGVGTAVGAGVGTLIGLFGGGGRTTPQGTSGSPARDADAGGLGPSTDWSTLLTEATARSGPARARSADLGAGGDEALAIAQDYFKRLAGGDPATAMTATQPARAQVIDQYDGARRSAREFGGRGGGTNTAIADSYTAQAGDLAALSAGARTRGAEVLAALGTQQQGLALTADQLAAADIDQVIRLALGTEQLDVQRAQLDVEREGQRRASTAGLAQALGLLLGQYLTRNKAA